MRPEDLQDFSRFSEELQRETDRGLALVGAAWIDDKLAQILLAFLCEGKAAESLLKEGDAPLGTFSARIALCHALGLIDSFEHQEITLLRKVRNEFAHAKHGTTFKTEKIKSLCSTLKSHLPEGGDYPTSDPRFRFQNSILAMTLRLFYRPEYVAKERRAPKTWMPEDFTRWRVIGEEMPPPGVPVLGLAKDRRSNAP